MPNEERPTAAKPQPVRRRGAGVPIVVAVGLILVLSMALVAFYSSYAADTNAQHIAALESQLRELATNEQLIGSELGARGSASPTSSASAVAASGGGSASKGSTSTTSYLPADVAPQVSGQPKVSAQQAALGVRMVLGRVLKTGAKTPSGEALTFKPGGYYEGSIAFSVAASHGDVVRGAYYVDGTTTRTIDAHMLSGADVSVYGWDGSASSKLTAIHAADLAKVLPGGSNAKDPWKSAWYWLEIGPGMAIIKVIQLPQL